MFRPYRLKCLTTGKEESFIPMLWSSSASLLLAFSSVQLIASLAGEPVNNFCSDAQGVMSDKNRSFKAYDFSLSPPWNIHGALLILNGV